MKTIGIQIKSNEAIMVVLAKDTDGNITQMDTSAKFKIDDHMQQEQVRQFREQVSSFFDSVNPDKVGILVRNPNAKGQMTPSPISFKLEGIIQLNDKKEIGLIWKKTLNAFFKKNEKMMNAEKIYQSEAFDVAYYLINQ
ncbi:DUF3010 family protein [Elizabethkingia anophelis]|nr:DUF3010 family protein [Elizabethkingia anophelis]